MVQCSVALYADADSKLAVTAVRSFVKSGIHSFAGQSALHYRMSPQGKSSSHAIHFHIREIKFDL